MTVIKVEGMHCEKCVERITKAMTEDGLDFKVSLADKTVTIDGCEHCVSTALETLDDLGFEGTVE
ncbi:heavy-metal-associated domain-containing protein [Luxibacter massiliensis]|uniref:heavy-metal-associated domain-containing protein n=1 Tax=Luxibacter massiliensis TaxID=2219695 RepID=UPI000F06DC61|nr:heavy metal-associated domain-containing protein [Luxibacter massiliensis]